MWCVRSIVECPSLKSNWWFGINPLFSTISKSLFYRSFQKFLIQWVRGLLTGRMLTD
jgi:hypothetical protein